LREKKRQEGGGESANIKNLRTPGDTPGEPGREFNDEGARKGADSVRIPWKRSMTTNCPKEEQGGTERRVTRSKRRTDS